MCAVAANTHLALRTLVCEEAVSCGALCSRRSPFHSSVEDKWATIPQFSSLHAWWRFVRLTWAHGGWTHETVPAEASRLKSIAHLFLFASRWCTNYDLDIIPQQGLERFLELRRSSKTRNEAASKHSASFTVQFHVTVSQLFNFFILYGLIGPVGKLLHRLWRAESWADSFQRWFASDRISPLFDLRSLSRYHHAKANGTEGKLQLLERGRIFAWWGVLFRPMLCF